MHSNRPSAFATRKPGVSADRKAAAWIGVLYIIGTVALVLSWAVTGALLTGPAYLAQVAAQPDQVAVGSLVYRRGSAVSASGDPCPWWRERW